MVDDEGCISGCILQEGHETACLVADDICDRDVADWTPVWNDERTAMEKVIEAARATTGRSYVMVADRDRLTNALAVLDAVRARRTK